MIDIKGTLVLLNVGAMHTVRRFKADLVTMYHRCYSYQTASPDQAASFPNDRWTI